MISENRQIAFIDVSKAVAALCISLYHFIDFQDHTGKLIEKSTLGLEMLLAVLWSTVFVFFVISGFAIVAHLDAARYKISDLPKFLGKRMIRIYFPFLVCILGYILLEIFFNWYNDLPAFIHWRQFFSNLTFTSDFMGEKWYNAVFWTLAIEIQFYLLIAFLYPVFKFFTHRKLFAAVVLFCLGMPFVVPDNRLVFLYLPMLCIGYALFEERNQSISKTVCIATILFCCALSAYLFESVLVGCMLMLFAGLFLFAKVKDRFPRFSAMTYSYYLFHGLSGGTFLYFTARYADSVWLAVLLIAVALAVSTVFSHLVFVWIEKPSVSWSKKWIRYRK